jgi:hypothetical protein
LLRIVLALLDWTLESSRGVFTGLEKRHSGVSSISGSKQILRLYVMQDDSGLANEREPSVAC